MTNCFLIKNPNGNTIAVFVDKGMALNFCHSQGYPKIWIHPAEITVRITANER